MFAFDYFLFYFPLFVTCGSRWVHLGIKKANFYTLVLKMITKTYLGLMRSIFKQELRRNWMNYKQVGFFLERILCYASVATSFVKIYWNTTRGYIFGLRQNWMHFLIFFFWFLIVYQKTEQYFQNRFPYKFRRRIKKLCDFFSWWKMFCSLAQIILVTNWIPENRLTFFSRKKNLAISWPFLWMCRKPILNIFRYSIKKR